jgi:hypothetical protein
VRSQPVHVLDVHESDRAQWPRLMQFIEEHRLFPIVHFRTTRRTLKHDATAASSAASSAPAASSAFSACALPLSSFTVVLDEADFLRAPPPRPDGQAHRVFALAEVELLLVDPSEADMRQAEQQVTDFAALLERGGAHDAGATTNDRAPLNNKSDGGGGGDAAVVVLPRGKVERYLALFRPWHFRLLGILVTGKKHKQ